MKKLYTINEFSKLSGVDSSKLRFYDSIGLFSPIKRNEENNYRYYALEQLFTLNFISVLSELGLPLKDIAELRYNRTPEDFLRILEKRERELDMELRELRLRSSIIHARQELIRYGLRVDEDQVSILHRDDKALILWPRNEYEEGNTFIEPLAHYVNKADEFRIDLNFPIGGYWEDMAAFLKAPGQPQHFFSIDPLGNHIRKSGDYVVAFSRGYYGDMGDLPDRMGKYIDDESVKISGPVYLMYLYDEICTQDPTQYLVQVIVGVP